MRRPEPPPRKSRRPGRVLLFTSHSGLIGFLSLCTGFFLHGVSLRTSSGNSHIFSLTSEARRFLIWRLDDQCNHDRAKGYPPGTASGSPWPLGPSSPCLTGGWFPKPQTPSSPARDPMTKLPKQKCPTTGSQTKKSGKHQ